MGRKLARRRNPFSIMHAGRIASRVILRRRCFCYISVVNASAVPGNHGKQGGEEKRGRPWSRPVNAPQDCSLRNPPVHFPLSNSSSRAAAFLPSAGSAAIPSLQTFAGLHPPSFSSIPCSFRKTPKPSQGGRTHELNQHAIGQPAAHRHFRPA